MVFPTRAALFRGLSVFLFGTLVFSLAYTQAPLYYSNQQQYFLHGLAQAGFGNLDQDWLANTVDPTPIFTALVSFTAGSLHESLFHGYYAILQGIYFVSLWGLFRIVSQGWRTPWREVGFLVAMVAVHSTVGRVVSMQLLGNDYPWYLQTGLAGQYVLGPVFQPSTFGVLLLTSLWAYAAERRFLAVTLAALAAVFHATYMLLGGILVFSFLMTWIYQGNVRASLVLGLWALLLVIPTAVYSWIQFGPDGTGTAERAREILVEYRIPHHAVPRQWFDPIAAGQILWMLIGVALSRGTRLFPILAMLFAFGVALTGLEILTESTFLALLFPWRVSVILVPVATAMVVIRLLGVGAKTTESESKWRTGPIVGLTAASVLFAGAGVFVMAKPLGFHAPDEELAVLEHIRDHKSRDDVYLIPVKPWKPSPPWGGSQKSDFKPPPDRGDDPRFIPIDLQRFRLTTGAPIYIDFKSIPYKDTEVIEWRERLFQNQDWHAALDEGDVASILEDLRKSRVTHIVRRADMGVVHPSLIKEFDDGVYHVYRITSSP